MKIWNNNQEECYQLGREFLRIFINVSKMSEFQKICQDLSQNFDGKPLTMHLFEKKTFGGLNIFVQQLIPVHVERKLEFLLNDVPSSSYTFYLKWFFDSIGLEFGQESESLLVDIVRYVIVNIHPPNEIIFESEVFQRYMFVGNIITHQAHFIHQPWVL